MKILFYSNKNDETYEYDDNALLLKEDYQGLILFVKVIIATVYAFGLGYNLYYYSEKVIQNFLTSLKYIIIFYIALEFVYAIFTAFLLPKALNNNVTVNLRLFKSTNYLKEKVDKVRVITALLIPFLTLALIPNIIISVQYSFTPLLYAFLFASTVKGSSYLIYAIIILLKDFDDEISVQETAYLNIKK